MIYVQKEIPACSAVLKMEVLNTLFLLIKSKISFNSLLTGLKWPLTFAARDLLGGDNYYWQGTPLIQLYDYYLEGDEENHDYAVEEAGKAAGRLLKEVLINDKRTFETEEGYTRMYRWNGEETNK